VSQTPTPKIGELVHRLALHAPLRTPDGAGGTNLTFALVAEVWGSIETIGGTESQAADRLAGSVTHAIIIRHRPGVTPDHRFALGPRTFAIRAVLDHDGRRRFLECRCEAIVT
jgi:SPP1 family predicted phage head-tail adaptor